MEAEEISFCALRRVSKLSVFFNFFNHPPISRREETGKQFQCAYDTAFHKLGVLQLLMELLKAQLPLAPALQVTLVTYSPLPVTASPAAPCSAPAPCFLPFNKHLVGCGQLPGQLYSPDPRNGSSNFNSFSG